MPTTPKTWTIPLALLAVTLLVPFYPAEAESLFRAGISYQTSAPYTPRSLFAVPRPNNVGDIVTILISENTSVTVQNNIVMNKEQSLTENSTNVLNRVLNNIFGTPRDLIPSANGIENEHEIGLRAAQQKLYNYNDTITAQVVQVLPNGNLLVQGKKTVWANQEQQDLYITGIVNPYYLDARGRISSNQVANLQVKVSGHGFITRQQGDGIIGKYFNLFTR